MKRFEKTMLKFPFLTTEQIQKLEEVSQNKFGILPTHLADAAGLALAMWIRQVYASNIRGMRTLFVVGSGKNGGDGLIAAKWLSVWGAQVAIATMKPIASYPMPLAKYFDLFEKLETPFKYIEEFNFQESAKASDLIIDCVFGAGLQSSPRALQSSTIDIINACKVPVISADLPSGMGGAGEGMFSSVVTATTTIAFGTLKEEYLIEGAKAKIGELILADVGIPCQAFKELGLEFPSVFLGSGFLKVDLGQFEPIKKKSHLHTQLSDVI